MKALLSSCHLYLVHLLRQPWPQQYFPGERTVRPALKDVHQGRWSLGVSSTDTGGIMAVGTN